MRHLFTSILFGALTATSGFASTYSTFLSYSASQSLFGGASTFSLGTSGTVNLGLGSLDYDIGVSSGTVDASVRAALSADFSRNVALADASSTSFKLNLDAPSTGSGLSFRTSFGAGVEVNASLFNTFDFNLIDEGARLDLSETNTSFLGRRQNPFGDSISDTENDSLVGVGPDNIFLTLNATGNVEQTSTLDVDGLTGILRATHSSGVVRQASFDFTDMTTLNLDLSLDGTWDLSILNAGVDNSFSSEFDFFVRGAAGAFGQTLSLDTPRIGFADVNPFALNFGTLNRSLGSIVVTAPVVEPPVDVVPLPAGMPLLLAGVGGFALLRRRKRAAEANPN